MPSDDLAGGEWLSVHLFFAGDVYTPAADRVVLEVVAPVASACLAAGWARRFFFVRYTEGGPHVRLRLLGRPGDLAARVEPLLRDHLAAGAGGVRDLAWTPYEPELERYGGPDGVALAERLFHDSSRAAIDLLRRVSPDDRGARLGKALLAMLVLLHAFLRSRGAAAALVTNFGEGYLRQRVPEPEQNRAFAQAFARGLERQADTLAAYVEAAWQALATGEGLPPVMDLYRERLREAAGRLADLCGSGRLAVGPGGHGAGFLDAAVALVPSYLHMMNNRLGISIHEESYLAVLAGSTLAGARRATA